MCFFKRFSSEVCVIVAWPLLQKCEIRCRKLKFCEGSEPDAWQTLGGGAEDMFRGTPENRICRYVDFLFIPFFRVLPRPPPPSVGPSQYQASRSASGQEPAVLSCGSGSLYRLAAPPPCPYCFHAPMAHESGASLASRAPVGRLLTGF